MAAKKKLNATQREVRRINRNLKQTIRRAKKNTNPLKIGANSKGKPIYIKGKSAQRERIRLAKANAFYATSRATGLRAQTNERFHKDARNLNFSSRKMYDDFMKWHNATAQNQMLNDRANSLRQSFRTRAEEIGISDKVMGDFEKQFKKLNNKELLETINNNMADTNITFNDTFDSSQEITDNDQMKQVVNMYRILGLKDQVNELTDDDINSGYVDNRNFVNYDYKQAARKENRRSQGRV